MCEEQRETTGGIRVGRGNSDSGGGDSNTYHFPFLTQLLPGSGRIDTAIWVHYMDSNKMAGEEARRQLHKNAASNLEQVLAATPHKTPTVRPPACYHENYSS